MSALVRVAGVILYCAGRVLLQHRDDNPEIVWPGHWAIFGGHMEPGEEPEAAALRELVEELELRLEGPLELFSHRSDGVRERFIFAAPLTVALETLVQHEGQAMALLSLSDLDAYPLVPAHREILKEFFASRL